MESSTVFAVDPRGYKVYCSDEQMEKIYKHHPELINCWANVEDMKNAIEKAQSIYQSTHGDSFNVYYYSKPRKNVEIKVVVKFDNKNAGILWAVQPSTVGQRKPGEKMIWPQSRN